MYTLFASLAGGRQSTGTPASSSSESASMVRSTECEMYGQKVRAVSLGAVTRTSRF